MSAESEAGMVYDEIHAVLKRYLNEGDQLTAFGIIGALEAVKLDVCDNLKRWNETREAGQ